MGWASALGKAVPFVNGIAGIFGGSQSASGSRDQARAAQAGMDYSKQVYGDAQNNFQPYMGLGQSGVNSLMAMQNGDNSGWNNSAEYLGARDAGQYAMDHGAAARGRMFSGGFQMDAMKGQADIANQYQGQYLNRQMGLAGLGQSAANSLGQIGGQTAQAVNSAYTRMGQAQADGKNAWGDTATGLAGIFAKQYGK